MSKIHRVEDIEAWQMGRTLMADVYELTLKNGFEGFERGSNKEALKENRQPNHQRQHFLLRLAVRPSPILFPPCNPSTLLPVFV